MSRQSSWYDYTDMSPVGMLPERILDVKTGSFIANGCIHVKCVLSRLLSPGTSVRLKGFWEISRVGPLV